MRATDTPEFARILEADFAKACAELAALSCSMSALLMENANLKHQIYAKDQELARYRKAQADSLIGALGLDGE